MFPKILQFKKTLITLSLFLFILAKGSADAFAFIVRQESYSANGVLVSRPVVSDERIVFLFYQNNIQTIEDYARWLKTNISYRKDVIDHWAQPEETIAKKYGDCEDYALLNAEVLRVFGYKPHIFALTRSEGNHAVCAFEKDGYYFWFDNNVLKESKAESLKELAQEILFQYNFSSLLEYQSSSERWEVLFKAA